MNDLVLTLVSFSAKQTLLQRQHWRKKQTWLYLPDQQGDVINASDVVHEICCSLKRWKAAMSAAYEGRIYPSQSCSCYLARSSLYPQMSYFMCQNQYKLIMMAMIERRAAHHTAPGTFRQGRLIFLGVRGSDNCSSCTGSFISQAKCICSVFRNPFEMNFVNVMNLW